MVVEVDGLGSVATARTRGNCPRRRRWRRPGSAGRCATRPKPLQCRRCGAAAAASMPAAATAARRVSGGEASEAGVASVERAGGGVCEKAAELTDWTNVKLVVVRSRREEELGPVGQWVVAAAGHSAEARWLARGHERACGGARTPASRARRVRDSH